MEDSKTRTGTVDLTRSPDQPDVDPVLRQLVEYAHRAHWTHTALAQRIGVSRPTLVGWLAHLRAQDTAAPPSRNARRFRFQAQTEEVQHKIAATLSKPVEALLSQSTDEREGTAAAVTTSGAVMRAMQRAPLSAIAAEVSNPNSLRHRIAEVTESVKRVGATTVVEERRGRRFRHVEQHQIVVHAVTRKSQPEGWESKLRTKIQHCLDSEGYMGYWEHGVKTPQIQINLDKHDASGALAQIGSLVSPYLAAPRAPETPYLGRSEDGSVIYRTGVVVSAPYGGSVPTAGCVAQALRAGHIRIDDLVRMTASARRERDAPRKAIPEKDDNIQAAFVAHQALAGLHAATIPGAWLLSMETKPIELYQPLKQGVTDLPDVLISITLHESLYPLAAWRLAAASLNQQKGEQFDAESAETSLLAHAAKDGIYSSDQIEERDAAASGRLVGGGDENTIQLYRAVLEHQRHIAQAFKQDLCESDALLRSIAEQRKAAKAGVIELTCVLPKNVHGLSYDGEEYAEHSGDPADPHVLYPDTVDDLVDEWCLNAGRALLELRNPKDKKDTKSFADGPGRKAVRQLLRSGAAPS